MTRFIEVIELVLIRSACIQPQTGGAIYHHFFAQLFYWQEFKTNPLSVYFAHICIVSSVHHVILYTFIVLEEVKIFHAKRKSFDKMIRFIFILEQINIVFMAFKILFIHQCHKCYKLSSAINVFIYCYIFKKFINF